MYVGASDDIRRHHQHLERPSEADLGECLHCDGNVFCTHLPLIVIDTHGAIIPGRPLAYYTRNYTDLLELETFVTGPNGETEIIASISVIDNLNDWNHIDDIPIHESPARMRIRGNSSRFFDKPNYFISLVDPDDHEQSNPLPLLGMNPHQSWQLHGPFLDKTLMRNYMWMNIGSEVMGQGHFVPNVRFFELILNGEYQGVYILMEMIRVNPQRLSMNRYRSGMPATSYLMRMDSNNRTPERHIHTFYHYTLRLEAERNMGIMYPDVEVQHEAMLDYVARSISTTERLLHSPEIVWYNRPYEPYIDVDSFVNFFILNEFIVNNDLWSNSTYIHKDIRGRIVAGPVWDFNNVMDNFFQSMPADQFHLVDRGWFSRLMMCPDYTDRVIRRWNQLRRNILSEERLINYMQDVEDFLGSAIDRNFEVWGYSFDPFQVSHMARRLPNHAERAEGLTELDLNPASFEEAMNHHRDYVIARGRWLDRYIESLRQYSHPSRHALWTLR